LGHEEIMGMRGRSILLAVALGWITVTATAGAAGANCGAEGCPLAPQGPEAAQGRFSFDFGYQFVEANRSWDGNQEISAEQALEAEGGLGHVVEQLTLTRALLFNARARVTDRLLLTASVPYIDRVHRHALAHHAGFFIPSEWHMKGPGDASVMAHWTVLGGSGRSAGSLILQAGLKLPTGETKVEELDGETPEPPSRPGSGSTDAMLGATYVRPLTMRTLNGQSAAVPLSVGVSTRLNGRGSEDYRMGNEWLASLGGGYALTRQLQLLAQLNASAHSRDEIGNTDATPHNTGSTALFASPGLRVEIVPGMSAFAYYQFRLVEHTNGPQLVAPYHVIFGMGYALGR
jgi:hypothetical protein